MNLNVSYPVNNPPLDIKLSIAVIMGMPPLSMILYVPLLYIILTNRKKYNNPFYKLVVVIGLNDYVLLLHFMYWGTCLIYEQCPFGEAFNEFQMVIAMMTCYGCMLLNMLIAWNRFAAVFFHHYYDTHLFTKSMTYFYVFLVYTVSASANIPVFMFGAKIYPQWNTFWFVRQPSLQFIEIWQIGDVVFAYMLHLGLIGMYLAAFIRCYKMTGRQSTEQLKTNRRFLYMAAINGIPCLTYVNCYHFGSELSAHFFAMLCMILTPFVYMWFNAELRQDLMRLMCRSSDAYSRGTSQIFPSSTIKGQSQAISNNNLAASLAAELVADNNLMNLSSNVQQ
uniref:7TM GPCR serpentine receptor class x (Srx) domain-containing protein n=1 Tax=Acrobeloides nanus TaxID=290746 RepID=A0A914BZN8_9BILA